MPDTIDRIGTSTEHSQRNANGQSASYNPFHLIEPWMEPGSMTEKVTVILVLSIVFDPDKGDEDKFSVFIAECGMYIKLTIMRSSVINQISQPFIAPGAENGFHVYHQRVTAS